VTLNQLTEQSRIVKDVLQQFIDGIADQIDTGTPVGSGGPNPDRKVNLSAIQMGVTLDIPSKNTSGFSLSRVAPLNQDPRINPNRACERIFATPRER